MGMLDEAQLNRGRSCLPIYKKGAKMKMTKCVCSIAKLICSIVIKSEMKWHSEMWQSLIWADFNEKS